MNDNEEEFDDFETVDLITAGNTLVNINAVLGSEVVYNVGIDEKSSFAFVMNFIMDSVKDITVTLSKNELCGVLLDLQDRGLVKFNSIDKFIVGVIEHSCECNKMLKEQEDQKRHKKNKKVKGDFIQD